MSRIEIYTAPFCSYCTMAKRLLKEKGAEFIEIDVSREDGLRESMMARAGGRRTVPQIFIGDQHVGGCDDLYALDKAGGLDPLLGRS